MRRRVQRRRHPGAGAPGGDPNGLCSPGGASSSVAAALSNSRTRLWTQHRCRCIPAAPDRTRGSHSKVPVGMLTKTRGQPEPVVRRADAQRLAAAKPAPHLQAAAHRPRDSRAVGEEASVVAPLSAASRWLPRFLPDLEYLRKRRWQNNATARSGNTARTPPRRRLG